MRTFQTAWLSLAGAMLLFTLQTGAQQTGSGTTAAQPGTAQTQSQTAQNQNEATNNQTMTMTGCVGGTGAIDQPFVLSNISVLGTAPGTTTGVTGTSGGAGNTPGTATGPGSAAAPASAGTYQLTGRDLSAYVGRRVQVVGTVTPTAASSGTAMNSGTAGTMGTTGAAGTTGTTGTAGTPGATGPIPQFKVQSVNVLPGTCGGM